MDETGADGLIPMRELGREYFHFDRESQSLMGADTGTEIRMGQRVLVRLTEAVPVTGGLILDLLELQGKALPRGEGAARKRGGRRKEARGRGKARKTERKVRRRRQ